ncbi:MAG: hypothetical protein N3B16_04870 [Candidatus Aminicenantes bacterium]|nr:hypothetical protein [Candidatus Aminicenantes bacterium]
MKSKSPLTLRLLVVAILVLFPLSLVASPSLQKQKPQQPKGAPIFIPNEVKSVMLAGMTNREPRLDIPFTVVQNIFLPAREGLHSIFLLKIKNADLGYRPISQEQGVKKEEAGVQETQVQPLSSNQLQASFNMFLMFNVLEGNSYKTIREVYVPCNLIEDAATIDLEKEDYYFFGYPLLAGNYLLSVAITSLDLKKIGVQYYEFSLPDPASFQNSMETTPIFFIKSIDRIEAPEMRTTLHRGFFTYSVVKIVPNIDRIFSLGENLDIFFFIFGAQPSAEQKYNIEINYEVKKDEELAIRWVPQTYDNPLVSQPLPLKQTVIVKQGNEQRQETRDLPEGKYTLGVQIQDKISGKTLTKTIDFQVK